MKFEALDLEDDGREVIEKVKRSEEQERKKFEQVQERNLKLNRKGKDVKPNY